MKDYDKYLKYKKKYMLFKQLIKNQIGGVPNNFKNILVMGAGPIGMISTLALLKKYPSKYAQDKSNCIVANNIFLLGKDNPWRPQIFFMQNSYRDYASFDYIRDIDLDTYKILEQVGCYSGSAPTTNKPYCYSTVGSDKSYTPSLLGQNNNDVRAPSNLPNNPEDNANKKLYLLTHLQFQVSDLETILLDRIIHINNEHSIDYLNKLDQLKCFSQEFKTFIKSDELEQFIKDKLLVLESEKQEHINFIKALLIKNTILEVCPLDEQLKLNPIVIIYHPFNKFQFYNSYQIYLYLKSFNPSEFKTKLSIPGSPVLQQNIITDAEISLVGNIPSTIWNLKKDDYNNIDFLKGTKPEDIIFKFQLLNASDFDFVFDTEANNKQFGNKEDYYTLTNRDTMDKGSYMELRKNCIIAAILKDNYLIKLTNGTNEDFYVISKKEIMREETVKRTISFTIKFSLYKLILPPSITGDEINDLNNFIIEKSASDENIEYSMIISIPTFTFTGGFSLPSAYSTEQIFENFLTEEDYKSFRKHLNESVLTNFTITSTSSEVVYNNIYKINSLKIKEEPLNLKDTPKKALVFASVWMYDANEEKNTMQNKQYRTVKIFDDTSQADTTGAIPDSNGDDGLIKRFNNIPLCSGPMCEGDTTKDIEFNYTMKFNKIKEFLDRIKNKSIVEQIYINNDQVQYFNNEMQREYNQDNALRHENNGNFNPQHVFRVFGVNLYKDSRIIENNNLKKFMNITSTNKKYYCGMQISTELNSLLRDLTNPNEKDIIFKFLFLLGILYTRDEINYDTNNNVTQLLTEVNTEWSASYGRDMDYANIEQFPIHSKMKSIFPITLKYKLTSIENINNKTIFNLGDSNTSVNFFSGTGLNTGIATSKFILENYSIDNDGNTRDMNEKLRIKNRRTIYNSLLSSQNPSHLSRIRNFSINSDPTRILENVGFYRNMLKNKLTREEINGLVSQLNDPFYPEEADLIKPPSIRQLRFFNILRNWNTFFANFLAINYTDPSRENIDKIELALYWNLYVFYYNLYLENPVLGPWKDPQKESITYLNNLIFNYSDHCNFNKSNPDINSMYTCDLLKNPDNADYDPQSSEGLLFTKKLDT